MKKNRSAIFFIILTIVLWGTTPAVGKLLVQGLSNIQVLYFTSLFATITLLIISILNGKVRHITHYSLTDYFVFSYMGFIGIFLFYFFFYNALSLLSAQEASIINFLWPIVVVILSFFLLKEKFFYTKIIGIILSFAGVIIVISKGNILHIKLENGFGVIFGVCGAICYGLFSVLSKRYNYERFTSTMFYYLFAFIYTLIAITVFSSIPSVSLQQFFGLLWLGIFTSGIGFISWFFALKYGDTAKMANMIFLTPFLSLVYIYYLTGEKILISSVLGLAVIMLGIIIQSRRKSRQIIHFPEIH